MRGNFRLQPAGRSLREFHTLAGKIKFERGIGVAQKIDNRGRPFAEQFCKPGMSSPSVHRGTYAADRNGADAGFAKRDRFKFALANDELSPERTALARDVELRAAISRREVFCAGLGLSRRRRPKGRPFTIREPVL